MKLGHRLELNSICAQTANETQALVLTREASRVIELLPATVPAFVRLLRWSTTTFLAGKGHSGRFTSGNDEVIVNNDITITKICATVYATIGGLETLARRQRPSPATSIFDS